MKKGVYHYYVRAQDVDFCKQTTIVSLLDYVLEAAGDDADKNGFGVNDLNRQNQSWVLSRMSLEVSRMPNEYEHFDVTTWVSEIGCMMTTRNLVVTDTKGERIAAAVTNWAMIDLTSRRPLDMSKNENYTNYLVDEGSPIEHPCKIRPGATVRERQHTVVYSDIDFNGHTNTVKYIRMMLDTLPLETFRDKRFKRLDTNFIKESRYGDTLTVKVCLSDPSRNCFEIVNEAGDVICRALVEWSDN